MKRLLVIAPFLLMAACSRPAATVPAKEAPGEAAQTDSDQSVEAYRDALLHLAFKGVSKMPLNPHIKNRSRSQIRVIDAWLELGQAQEAEECLAEVMNWQRWAGYVHLAAYYAGKNDPVSARKALAEPNAVLEMADKIKGGEIVAISGSPLIETLTDWRYDQVKAEVLEVEQQLVGDEADIPYETAMANLRTLAASENFEIIHAAQLGMIRQVDRIYSEVILPEWITREIEPGFAKMPVFLKIDVLNALARICIAHNDASQAIDLLQRSETMVSKASLPPRLYTPEMAKIMTLWFNAGKGEDALLKLDQVQRLYDERSEYIVDIERTALLCRLAEVRYLAGQSGKALELYNRAIDEGLINPNSRPRADALSEICRSMARTGLAPSATLLSKLQSMQDELGNPW